MNEVIFELKFTNDSEDQVDNAIILKLQDLINLRKDNCYDEYKIEYSNDLIHHIKELLDMKLIKEI